MQEKLFFGVKYKIIIMTQYLSVYSSYKGDDFRIDGVYHIDIPLTEDNLIKIAESLNNKFNTTYHEYDLVYEDNPDAHYKFTCDELKTVLERGSYNLGTSADRYLYPLKIRIDLGNTNSWDKLSNIINT